jgi:class 3 adenylate cyclase/DNA-binding CsgD family transcriptional regulator
MRPQLPAGTVTLLFTDVEASTGLLRELGSVGYAAALATHRRTLGEAVAARGGLVVDAHGDALFAVFATARDALAAAAAAQAALAAGPVRVRIGIHTGTPLLEGGAYVGIDVHRAARIADAAHGGQVLVSAATRALVADVVLADLGEHRLRGLDAPERLYQLGEAPHPPPRSLAARTPAAEAVVGRERELAALGAFLDGLGAGAAAALLEGEAGAGKTTLWRAAVEDAGARGLRVLAGRPGRAEAELSFSAVADLLGGALAEAGEELPGPQRRALAVALLLEEPAGTPPDSRAVGAAVLGVLRLLSRRVPVLLSVDDVQWLDAPSAEALLFAARRLGDEPVGVLLARRAGHESTLPGELARALPEDRVLRLEVGPLGREEVHRLLVARLGLTLSRPALARLHEASGGNALFAVELGRSLAQRGDDEAAEPPRVPPTLRELVGGRLAALPEETGRVLLAAAALSQPAASVAARAAGEPQEALAPALAAEVVELDGDRLRFTHPLLAAGAYDAAGPLQRRRAHERLAALVADPEEQARHLALAADGPDEAVADALERAAASARARGAPAAAARLLERAAELTPPERDADALRRRAEAGSLHFESGDSRRAAALLERLPEPLAAGPVRADVLARLARVRSYEDQARAAKLFLQAIEEAGDERSVLATAHEGAAACLFRLRERLPEAAAHAGRAVELALALGDEALAAEALGTQVLARSALGDPEVPATLERALALQPAAELRRVLGQPLLAAGVHWWWTDELERARDAFERLLTRAGEVGDESSQPYVLALLGQVECALGDLDAAAARAAAGRELAVQAGQATVIALVTAVAALADALRGRTEAAEEAARSALELAAGTVGRPAEAIASAALGDLALSRGDPAGAAAALEPRVRYAREHGIDEPGATPFVPDYVEALVELGRLDEAEAVLAPYAAGGERLGRASALAAAARCRGLLAAAAGDGAGALAALEEALGLHAGAPLPLSRARTLLVLGVALRRAKRKRPARDALEEALGAFERAGAALWAERARGEVARIGGRAPSTGALTPAEERVAALVAEGRTNREVAAALFLSDRTVEGHLSRVYAKLGVRSRTELARVLATRRDDA